MILPPLTLVLIAAAIVLLIPTVIVPTVVTLRLWVQIAWMQLRMVYTVAKQCLVIMNSRADSLGVQLNAMQDDLKKYPITKRSREEQIEHMNRYFMVYTASIVAKFVVSLVVCAIVAIYLALN